MSPSASDPDWRELAEHSRDHQRPEVTDAEAITGYGFLPEKRTLVRKGGRAASYYRTTPETIRPKGDRRSAAAP
jgi:hypothetical protein